MSAPVPVLVPVLGLFLPLIPQGWHPLDPPPVLVSLASTASVLESLPGPVPLPRAGALGSRLLGAQGGVPVGLLSVLGLVPVPAPGLVPGLALPLPPQVLLLSPLLPPPRRHAFLWVGNPGCRLPDVGQLHSAAEAVTLVGSGPSP